MEFLKLLGLGEWTRKRVCEAGHTLFHEGDSTRVIYQVVRGGGQVPPALDHRA